MQLSLKRAVEIALAPEGSQRVELAQQSVDLADAHVKQARRAFLPVLDGSIQERSQTANLKSFGFGFDFLLPPGFPPISIPTFVGPFNVFDTRASAQVPVIDFALIARLRTQRSGLEAAKSDLDATRNQVSDRVARAYLLGVRADAALEAAQANVDLANALVRLADQQRLAGTGTGIEVTRQRVQLANDQQRLLVAQNDRKRALFELLRAMDVDLATELTLTDRLMYQPIDVSAVEAQLERARSDRAELRGQKQRETTARLSYEAIRKESLPSVSAFGDYGVIGPAINDSRATRTVGVNVKIPIFDERRKAREEDSFIQYRQEKIRTSDLQQQIELEVREAIEGLKSAQGQVDTSREGLMLAQNELEQAQRRYQAGVSNSIEVTDAQTRLDRARDNSIAALYNHSLARIDLATATGSISEYVNQ
jgi:outer membrane protein